MKVCGIICEYNPFHYGHKHHIDEIKKQYQPDYIVCVMSGNFVQRGEPAIINKWERAKTAVEYGVDLIVELPFVYATQSANYFAKASVDILALLQVNMIVFGSESNDIEHLRHLSSISTDSFNEQLTKGISSAKAYEQLLGELNPNDILGINYIKYASTYDIPCFCIQRTNHYHETSLNEVHSSASAIRHAVYEQLPYTSQTPMHNLSSIHEMKHYYPYIKTLLLTCKQQQLSELFLMDEGIENLLIKNAKISSTYEDFITLCTSKRYTKSKIQRTLIHLMNQTTKEEVNTLPNINYVRVLAFNTKGKKYLKTLKETIIIASKFNQIPSPFKEMELKANYVYHFPTKQHENDELQSPIYINTD